MKKPKESKVGGLGVLVVGQLCDEDGQWWQPGAEMRKQIREERWYALLLLLSVAEPAFGPRGKESSHLFPPAPRWLLKVPVHLALKNTHDASELSWICTV